MPKHCILEIALAIIMVIGPLIVVYARLCKTKTITKDGNEQRAWGIGVRMIQLVAVLLVVPTIAILRLEDVISGEGAGTLLGTVVGYALGGIMNPVPKKEGIGSAQSTGSDR